MTKKADIDTLKSELLSLQQMTQRIRQEIDVIRNPSDETDHFQNISEQLNAIVQATEKATDTIMGAVENSDENIVKLRSIVIGNADAEEILNKMAVSSQLIFEACGFQDITGQRANIITTSLGYVEERINSIAALLDGKTIDDTRTDVSDKTEDEKLLNGPQLEGKDLMQSDIDALFD